MNATVRRPLTCAALALSVLCAFVACGRRENVGVAADRAGHGSGEQHLSPVRAADFSGDAPARPDAAQAEPLDRVDGGESGSRRPGAAPAKPAQEPAPPVPPRKRDLGGGKGGEPLGDPPGSGDAKPATESGADAGARLVVYRGDLRVAVQDTATAQAAAQRAAAEGGGFLSSLDDAGLTLRVPNARFAALVEAVAGLGVVRERRIRGEDVTADVADLRARLANAQAVRQRLAALVDKALRIDDALTIERELARVTEQIELIEGRLQSVTTAAAFATLAVRFDGPPPRVATAQATPASTLPRAFAWVAALGEEALRGGAVDDEPAGRGPKRALPDRFVRYHEGRDTVRALSARGVELKLSRHANRDGADAAYWMALARRVLADDRGYALGDEEQCGERRTPTMWTAATRAVGGVARAYVVAIACDGDDVLVIEAWGDPDALAAERDALRRAAERLARG